MRMYMCRHYGPVCPIPAFMGTAPGHELQSVLWVRLTMDIGFYVGIRLRPLLKAFCSVEKY